MQRMGSIGQSATDFLFMQILWAKCDKHVNLLKPVK